MAWNSSSIRNLAYVRNFEEAEKVFDLHEKPRGRDWSDNERPLRRYDGNRMHHYRLVRESVGGKRCFDVVLYSTPMARYYEPEGDKRVVLYNGHDSMASKQFRSNVLGIDEWVQEWTTDGVLAYIPVGGGKHVLWDGHADFCAKLTYVKRHDGIQRVLVAESDHSTLYRKVANEDDKARRKELHERLETVLTLALMRMPEFRDSCDPGADKGQPFKKGYVYHATADGVMRVARDPGKATPEEYNHFFEFAQHTFDVLVSKRLWAQAEPHSYAWSRGRAVTWDIDELEKPVTEAEFRTSLMGAINRLAGADKRSGRIELRKFLPQEDIPMSSITFYNN